MISKFDYNNDDVMTILNNPSYTNDQRKALFEKYKDNLKHVRKNEIINRLNEVARNNPIVTQEDYISMLKKYSDDDLSIPFETIEEDINNFDIKMKNKYQEYLDSQKKEEVVEEVMEEDDEIIPISPKEEVNIEENDDLDIDLKPDKDLSTLTNMNKIESNNQSLSSENENDIDKPIFEEKSSKEVLPEEIENGKEAGNASAMIISIIAIIIGIVIMYSILKTR